jgi:S-formylglutathione hydrolase FrmB
MKLTDYYPRLLLLSVLIFSSMARAQSRVDCNALNSQVLKQVVHYCVLVPASYNQADRQRGAHRYPVLYFLHGLGDNEQTLFKTGGWTLIDDLRQQGKIGDFLIVAPEGKRSFYINSADGSVPYSDFFLREFMPYIEGKYPIARARGARAIAGISMGGYGALRFAFAHPELFSAVSAQSAALMTESPQELNAAERSGSPLSGTLAAVFGHPINVMHWRANDPFVLARRNAAALHKLAIYFNCGQEDNYGFDKGAKALHQQLQAEGVEHEFYLYPGDHSPGYFLSHLGEMMEFHGRVFADQRK